MIVTDDYKIVEGHPEYVERAVSELLESGWELNSDLMSRKVNNEIVFVQGLAKKRYSDTQKNIYVFSLMMGRRFDVSNITNFVSAFDTGKYSCAQAEVIVKILASNKDQAKLYIDNELTLQNRYTLTEYVVDFIHEEKIN